MATPQLSPQPVLDGSSLTGVANLASLFLPKNSSTSGSSTTQNSGGISTNGTVTTSDNVSQDAVNALVKSILEGSQGLASVASGQARAGMYNSSTNELLVNDLIARAAAEGAKLNKTSTTTTNNVQTDNRTAVTSNNSTAQTQAPISGSTAAKGAGILGLLSIIPGDVKKGIMDKLSLGSAAKSVARAPMPVATNATPANTNGADPLISGGGAQTINPAAGAASVGTSNVPGIGIGATDSGTQSVSSISMPDVGSTASSGSGSDDFSNFISPSDPGFDLGTTDISSNGDAGGFSSPDAGSSSFTFDPNAGSNSFGNSSDLNLGPGDFGNDVNNSFDPGDGGDFFAAEGGLVTTTGVVRSPKSIFQRRKDALDDAEAAAVKGDDTNAAYQKSLTSGSSGSDSSSDNSNNSSQDDQKKSFLSRLIPSFAKGGMVSLKAARAPGYADGGMVDLTNVGLRTRGDSIFSTASKMDVGSGVQSIDNSALKAIQAASNNSPLDITPDANTDGGSGVIAGTQGGTSSVSSGSGAANSAGLVKSERIIDNSGDSLHSEPDIASLYTDTGPRKGAGNLGMTPGEAGVAGTVAGMFGVPGSIISMANASNNTQATNSFLTALAGGINPIAGLIAGVALKKFNPDTNEWGSAPTDTSDIAGSVIDGSDTSSSDYTLSPEDTANMSLVFDNINNTNATVGNDKGPKMFAAINNNAKGDAFLKSKGYSSEQIDQMRLEGISDYLDIYGRGGDDTFKTSLAQEYGFTKNPDGSFTNSYSAVGPMTGSTDAAGNTAPSANGSTGFVGGDTTEPSFSPAEAPGGQFGGTAFAAKGGKINGPGTGTSDSIHAMLSDGEYVHTAASTKKFGTGFMNAVNDGDPVEALHQLFAKGLVTKKDISKVVGVKNARA